MRKFLTLLMALVMSLGFGMMASACDEKNPDSTNSSTPADDGSTDNTGSGDNTDNTGGDNENVGSEVTDQEWNAAIQDVNFINVTILQTSTGTAVQTMKLGETPQTFNMTMDQTRTLKFTETAIYIHEDSTITNTDNGQVQPVDLHEYSTESEETSLDDLRSLYTDLFLAILAKKADFTYNAELGAYTLNQTVTINKEQNNSTVTEQVSNGKAVFDANGVLISFSCDLIESVTNDYMSIVENIDMTWTFSNYGTTAITQAEIDAANTQMDNGGSNPNIE